MFITAKSASKFHWNFYVTYLHAHVITNESQPCSVTYLLHPYVSIGAIIMIIMPLCCFVSIISLQMYQKYDLPLSLDFCCNLPKLLLIFHPIDSEIVSRWWKLILCTSLVWWLTEVKLEIISLWCCCWGWLDFFFLEFSFCSTEKGINLGKEDRFTSRKSTVYWAWCLWNKAKDFEESIQVHLYKDSYFASPYQMPSLEPFVHDNVYLRP